MGQWHPSISWVGHRVREAGVHVERLSQRADLPRVIFSVSRENDGYSSGLRGYAIAAELRNFGWRSSVIPKQLELSQRQRLMHLECPDVIVLQMGKHPLNRPKYYPNAICVFDIDDADFLYPVHRDGAIECMQNSSAVIAGSRFVADFARKYNSRVEVIWTGSSPTKFRPVQKLMPPVVAFAVSNASAYPEECELVMSALTRVRSKDWQFWLFGVNEPDVGSRMTAVLRERGISCRSFEFMNYPKFQKKMEMVSIGLAPIVPSNSPLIAGKSFGKILAYLNCRAATVASDFADHPLFFQNGINGYLASGPEEFAERIELLLSDSELREQIAERAYKDYIEKLSTRAVAKKTDIFFRELMGSMQSK
jgi:glycosyltransferase involved in cell wall biosynthesis